MTIQTIFDRTFLNFEGRLTGQVLILAGLCPLNGRYFELCEMTGANKEYVCGDFN